MSFTIKGRVFRNICLISVITALLASLIAVCVLYQSFVYEMRREIETETLYLSRALERSDLSYLRAVGRDTKNRITLIAADGTVLYDNFAHADSMDNHLTRPEVQAALRDGSGDSVRRSDTIRENTHYHAARLTDGRVLRLAVTSRNTLGVLWNALPWLLTALFVILITAVAAARRMTKAIVSPINALNLRRPLQNDTYDELSPLLQRMEKQNHKIAMQIEELTARQNEFTCITDNMSEGLIILGTNGLLLSANKSALRIFGVKPDLLTDNDQRHSYMHLCRDTDYITAVESALQGRQSSCGLALCNRLYRVTASPVAESAADGCAAVVFVIDVTEKEQAEKLRREFSANVSHELRTPLTSIMGYAEIIENGVAKAEDVQGFAGQISSEAKRLLSLIEDIIRLSRLDEQDSSSLRSEFTSVDLGGLCKEVLTSLADKASSAGISLELNGAGASVMGLPATLREIVYNLCDNAIAYNRRGGSLTVTVERDKAERPTLTVADTGIGIAPEHQSRVFERFYRVDKSHSKETGGTGLGLSIVKHGAMLHDAAISLTSAVNVGTTVTLTFPAA